MRPNIYGFLRNLKLLRQDWLDFVIRASIFSLRNCRILCLLLVRDEDIQRRESRLNGIVQTGDERNYLLLKICMLQ